MLPDNLSSHTFIVDDLHAHQRLDTYLASIQSVVSRSRISSFIQEGFVEVNGCVRKPSWRVSVGDTILLNMPPPQEIALTPQDIPIDILFEDADLVVVNKPAGMVVHPAPGHEDGTLVNAVLYHCLDITGIGGEIRPGIVHRLDQDTSGVIVIAKNEPAHTELSRQFKERETQKTYIALAAGVFAEKEGTINTAIGRHPTERKKMSIHGAAARDAVSHYTVLAQFEKTALLSIRIETGRTHQIRVHLASIGHPIVGDLLYGGRKTHQQYAHIPRQMLHAYQLSFTHPSQNAPCQFTAPIPADMMEVSAMYQPHLFSWDLILTS